MKQNRSSIPSRKLIAIARQFGVPASAWGHHIQKRKDVSWPIVYSFSLSLSRFGVDPQAFRLAVR